MLQSEINQKLAEIMLMIPEVMQKLGTDQIHFLVALEKDRLAEYETAKEGQQNGSR